MNKNQDNWDVFDRLFSQIENDTSSIADFGNVVKDSIDEAAKKKGYDSFAELLSAEISNSITNEKPQKPKVNDRHLSAETMSRFDYMMEAIKSVTYEPRYQGYYGTGHRNCLDHYVDEMSRVPNELCSGEEKVKADIKYYSQLLKKKKNDGYTQGYYDALVLLSNSLIRSKKAKMRDIKQMVLTMKEKAQ